MRRGILGLLAAIVLASLATVLLAGAARANTTFASTIHNQGDNKCLDVTKEDDYYAAHARIQQYHCTGAKEQQWTVYENNDDCYPYCPHWTIQSNRSLMCLEVRGASLDAGAQIDQDTCTGAPEQLWRPFGPGSESQFLVNVNSGLCLDLSNSSTADHARIQQWDCNGRPAQEWRF